MAHPPPRFYANIAPGLDFDQHSPGQFTASYLAGWLDKLGGSRETMGLSFAFSLLNGPIPIIAESTTALRRAAEETGIHVIPAFDIQNWWDFRSDLWNWFDPNRPGYSPTNRENVEWMGPGPEFATQKAWRNWGSQIRVAPPPNLRSKAYRSAGEAALSAVIKPWAQWLATEPYGTNVRTPGIKLGWEASLGVNAYVYPQQSAKDQSRPQSDPTYGLDHTKGLFGGLAPLGWAALHSAGRKSRKQIGKSDIEWIVRDYLQWMVDTARHCGISETQIYTHAGGQFHPYEEHISHDVACVRGAAPGWSLYNIRPTAAGDLVQAVNQRRDRRWCCAEWMSFAPSPEQWADDLAATLAVGKCHFLVAYNAQDLLTNPIAKSGLKLAIMQGLTRG